MEVNKQTHSGDIPETIFILYGSQTGQAEAIANEIHQAAVFENLNVKLFSLKDEGTEFKIEIVKCAIFVCSTTGDGDPPDNARKFVRKISRKTLPQPFLGHLSYALLGLGDSNYSTFCGGPKKLERALKACGACSFYPAGFADDGVDLEDTVEEWIDRLFPALKSHVASCSSLSQTDIVCDDIIKDSLDEVVPVTNGTDTIESNDGREVKKAITELNGLEIDLEVQEKKNTTSDANLLTTSDGSDVVPEHNRYVDIIQQEAILSSPILNSSRLDGESLTLPPLFPSYLRLSFDESVQFDESSVAYQNNAAFAVASSDLIETRLVSAKQITEGTAVKRAIEAKLYCESPLQFAPGDSFGICCCNDEKEVNWLIKRLSYENLADVAASLTVRTDTTKKNPSLPAHIPQPFTIRHVFTHCIEIRSAPKKPLLRALVECTSDEKDKRKLQELCSKQGASEYVELIRAANLSLLDLLATLPSCQPPFELLAQHLPRLQPRRYSIANSPLVEPNHLTFVFNVVRFSAENGRLFSRNGVCTGHLERFVTLPAQQPEAANMAPETCPALKVFLTKSTGFCLPVDSSQPIVMIGPGTGVAPFVGFLEHRSALNTRLGESWLFYGCRHRGRDFLYEEKLNKFKVDGVLTRLLVAVSREPSAGDARYVQDNIRLHSAAIVDLLLRKNAIFYVCGDARNMAKDVRQCVIEIIASETDCDQTVASEKFQEVLSQRRYREDVWT